MSVAHRLRLALTAAAWLAGGCGGARGLSFSGGPAAEPDLDGRPAVVTVAPEPSAEAVALADLSLGLPAGWRAGTVFVLSPGSPSVGCGQTVMVRVTGRQDGESVAAEVCYRPERSWLQCPPPALVDALSGAAAPPEEFLGRYASDLALMEAAHNARPRDLEGAAGDEARRCRALLGFKQRLLLPATRMVLPGGHAFVWACRWEPMLVADVFDAGGCRRGALTVVFPEAPGCGPERLAARLLAGARFADRP